MGSESVCLAVLDPWVIGLAFIPQSDRITLQLKGATTVQGLPSCLLILKGLRNADTPCVKFYH